MNFIRSVLKGDVVRLQNAESRQLETVEILGYMGQFDQFPIYKWRWLTGPDAGTEGSGYGRSFEVIEKPLKIRRVSK